MPTIPSPKSSLTLLKQGKNIMESRTGITDYSASSKARAMIDIFESEMMDQRNEKIRSFQSMDLGSVSGDALKRFGQKMGVNILDVRFANSEATTRNFAFYVEASTFGGINSASNIVIPANTTIFSDPNNNERGSRIEYQLATGVTLLAADSIQFVSVKAVTAGSGSNVGAGVIRNHSFSNYTQAGSGSLKVINFFPVLNGRDEETEDSYRYRISRYYDSLLQSNNAKLQLRSLGIPGVLDTRVIPGYFGIGTSAVVVLGADSQASAELTEQVQQRLNNIAAPGLYTKAITANEVGFELLLNIRPMQPMSTPQKDRLRSQIRLACLDYFRSLGIGGSVSLTALSDLIRRRTGSVIQFKKGVTEFKRVLVRRGQSNGSFGMREQMLDDIYPLDDIEYSALQSLDIEYIE